MRIVLLCEDQLHERVFRPICAARFGDRPRVLKQGASDKVLRRFPDEVRALRSKGAERVGLVVVIDGDNRGVGKRKEELAQALSAAGLSLVGPKERIAICIPTWSIETWLFALSGTESVDEARSYKRDWQKLSDSRDRTRAAVVAWQTGRTVVELPLFRAACAELERLD